MGVWVPVVEGLTPGVMVRVWAAPTACTRMVNKLGDLALPVAAAYSPAGDWPVAGASLCLVLRRWFQAFGGKSEHGELQVRT